MRGAGVEPACQAWKAWVVTAGPPTRGVGTLAGGYLRSFPWCVILSARRIRTMTAQRQASAFPRTLRPAGPDFTSVSSSLMASTRSPTSSPVFSRSVAISRRFGIVFRVSQSRVSFRSVPGSAGGVGALVFFVAKVVPSRSDDRPPNGGRCI